MNRRYLPFAAIALSLTLLVGCSGEKKESVAETVKEKAPEAATTVKEATPLKMAAAKKTVTEAVETVAETVKEKAAEAVSSVAPKEATIKNVAAVEKKAAPAQVAASPETVRLGGSIFKAKCVACHGTGGKGSAMAPGFVGNEWVKSTDIAGISTVIKNGRQGSAKKYKKFPMPMPAHATMKSEEVSALVHYIKSVN
jgi:mono/diheme cytochrome c family protein